MEKQKTYIVKGKQMTEAEYHKWVETTPKGKQAKLEKLDENTFKVKPLLEG